MADLLESAQRDEGRAERGAQGSWFPYETYRVIHDSTLDSLRRQGLVIDDRISFRESGRHGGFNRLNVVGRLGCLNGVHVSINIWFEARPGRDNRTEIAIRNQRYHAMLDRGQDREPHHLVRYDDAHGGLHRHLYDAQGIEVLREDVLPSSELPTLDKIVREAVELAQRHR